MGVIYKQMAGFAGNSRIRKQEKPNILFEDEK
jgi:hypothetical protein